MGEESKWFSISGSLASGFFLVFDCFLANFNLALRIKVLLTKILVTVQCLASVDLLFLIKNTMWVSTKRFVDLVRVCSSHIIISRNHFNTFLLINMQKKNLSKVKHCSHGYLFWYWNFDSVGKFLSVLMMCKWTGGYIYDVSLWGILLRGDLFTKKIPEKYPSIARNKFIVLAVRGSVKYFLPQIHHYSGKLVEKIRRREAITKRFAFQENAKRKIPELLYWFDLKSCDFY